MNDLGMCVIADLDGTLCDSTDRVNKYTENGKIKDWDGFYADAANDSPNEWCLKMLYGLQDQHIRLMYITGRPEKYRSLTVDWLSDVADLHADEDNLFMRKDGDFRPDYVVKEELYRQHIEGKYTALFAIDDRKRVVVMWRSLGLVCLTHCDGDF
jgi:hypothetical protein